MMSFENLKPIHLVFALILIILLGVFLTGCSKGIHFDPDFRVGDHTIPGIVGENGEIIPAADERFDNFACMSKEKIKELKEILMRAKTPASFNPVFEREYHLLMHRMPQVHLY